MSQHADTNGSTPRLRPRSARVPLATRAEEELKKAILNGDLLPGDPLIESELMARLGMSKTPIREALRLLANSGLLTSDRFRTWRVRRLSGQEVQDIFEIRAVLESTAAQKACTLGNQKRSGKLRNLIAEAESLLAQGALPALAAVNRSLHSELIADCGNAEIIRVLSGYEDALSLAILQGWNRLDSSEKEFHEHKAIIEAHLGGDAERVRRLMHEHISGFAGLYAASGY